MINKTFENIKIEDITQLIENGVPESKTIEYKLELNDEHADAKKEFLADLSSFANSEGGDLIYGLRCENGVPIEIIGIDVDNIDQKLLQLENIIRDGLSPRIIFNIKYIEFNSKYLFIFRVSKSWSKPHRIEYKNYHRFYGRNTAGKYLLDINELRNNFLSTNDIVTNIKNFITNRNTEILSNNGITKLNDGCKLVIYLIPLNSFVSNQTFDLFKVRDIFYPPSQYNWKFRTNLEGFLKYRISDENISSYVQLYRNGIIEAVSTNTFLDKEELLILGNIYEKMTISAIKTYLRIYEIFEIYPPVAFGLSFVDVKNYKLGGYVELLLFDEKGYEYSKDILRIPEVIISDFSNKIELKLKDSFDLVWNAFGFEKSLNYDDNGNWIQL